MNTHPELDSFLHGVEGKKHIIAAFSVQAHGYTIINSNACGFVVCAERNKSRMIKCVQAYIHCAVRRKCFKRKTTCSFVRTQERCVASTIK